MDMLSWLAFKSSSISKYDGVIIIPRDPEGHVQAFLKNKLRDVGITEFFQRKLWYSIHRKGARTRKTVVMILFTPDFLESVTHVKGLVSSIDWSQKGMLLLPVYCGVSKEEVSKKMQAFSPDIARVSSLPGFKLSLDFRNKRSGLIENLGLSVLHDESLFHDLPGNPVGLALRMREFLDNLGWRYILSDDTIIVGIWGDGGIGKTMIAKAIYDIIGGNFDGKSFLLDIKGAWEKYNGEIHLKKQLISDISKTELDETDDVMHVQMEQLIFGRRVLVVLDNVNCESQLEKLYQDLRWCGKGSLIIITARNEAIFGASVDISYEMKRLNSKESLELFYLHAFKKLPPTNDFDHFSILVKQYCDGLPLALEVLGSLLYDRTREDWKKIMNDIRGIQYGPIQNKLKISCDLLTDMEKDLFFNIAYFYVGHSYRHVTQSLNSSRLPVEMGMSVLIQRNLVKDLNDKLYVHDLLKEIAREISPHKRELKYVHDVFLSFRGDDTRKSFTSYLCAALKQAGVEVYMDEERMERGENISSVLLEAIESSRISIIIFSKNYADSSWCLQELEKIMECYRTGYQEVLPIFFDVSPSDVRKQQNAFGKAWRRLTKRTSSSKMKNLTIKFERILTEVANLSGWDMQNYSTEIKLIDEVVETITKKLGDNTCLFVAHHPVGLKSRMQDIIQLLQSKSKDIIIIAICGMGGIGKTMIAKAIYNQVGHNFEGKCFLANVREVWKQGNGPVYLQEQLLSDIYRSRRRALSNIEMGKTLLQKMLCKKNVLIVLDDVEEKNQLEALCGSRQWFGAGSRIIITTRNEDSLNIFSVIHRYAIKELDDNESLELFCWHAFKQEIPEQDFNEFSRRVVSYCGGLPLALEVLGSNLFRREKSAWKSVLEKLQIIPNNNVHEKLKISYDALSDDTLKEIFLDICCFFIGKDKSYVTQILNGCELFGDIGIICLLERSLLRVGNKNKLEMHDLLREMGREIIRQQFPRDPEKRSRLWHYKDVLDVLRKETGTISITGLTLNKPEPLKKCVANSLSLSARTFEKMEKLRLLQLHNVQLIGDYGCLPKNLKWLCWHGFPLEGIPTNFNLEKIVSIDLKWSKLVKLWEKSQMLEGLKSLNLSHSHSLIESPNFSKIPNLERLIFKDCSCLSIIHPSIGDLKYIVLLSLKDCKSLTHIPRSIYKLKSLKTLNLCGCSKINKLEEDIEQMESLTTLVATQTAIAQVPFSLVRLERLKHVSLCGYEGLPRDVFPSLVFSWMSPTHRSMSLSQAFQIRPSLIRGISHLSFLRRYETVESRPSTSQASCQNAPALLEFPEQIQKERSETLMSPLTIKVGRFNETILDTILQHISKRWNDGGLSFSLPIDNCLDWLVFANEGSSVSFKVPQVAGRCLKGGVLYIIYSSLQDSTASVDSVGILINNFTKVTVDLYKRKATTFAEEEWENMASNLEPGNEVKVEIKLGHNHIMVKKTVIYLVYIEEIDKLITSK